MAELVQVTATNVKERERLMEGLSIGLRNMRRLMTSKEAFQHYREELDMLVTSDPKQAGAAIHGLLMAFNLVIVGQEEKATDYLDELLSAEYKELHTMLAVVGILRMEEKEQEEADDGKE